MSGFWQYWYADYPILEYRIQVCMRCCVLGPCSLGHWHQLACRLQTSKGHCSCAHRWVAMHAVQNVIGFGVGGVCFSAGGFLLYAQAAYAKCRVMPAESVPSAGIANTASFDGEGHVLNGKEQVKHQDVLVRRHLENAERCRSRSACGALVWLCPVEAS